MSIQHKETVIAIDPQRNNIDCEAALITHAHLDHTRGLRLEDLPKFSSEETLRLFSNYESPCVDRWQSISLEEKIFIDDLGVIAHNSGHVLGSNSFEIVTPEGIVFFTGDFNTATTKTMIPADPVHCDVLILESTFGDPRFQFPSEGYVAKDMIEWAQRTLIREKIPVFQTDPLGNAQEIVRIFNESTDIPLVTNWRVSSVNKVYESYGYDLEYFDERTSEAEEIISSGRFVAVTPKRAKLRFSMDCIPALVSGWALWSREKAFPLSDHADFPRLLKFVEDCAPRLVLTCHSTKFDKILASYIEKKLGIRSYPINLIPTQILC